MAARLIRELNIEEVTKSELAVIVELTFYYMRSYYMRSRLRGKIKEQYPDIYRRLLGKEKSISENSLDRQEADLV